MDGGRHSVWASAFPGATVLAYPAGEGPQGGPAGGVALLLPHGAHLISPRELVPGCALEVMAALGDRPATRLVSLYLPDDHREEVLQQLRAALPADDIPTYVGGDLNFQFFSPRAGEQASAAEFARFLDQFALSAVAYQGPSRKDRRGSSQIDVLAVPRSGLWRWGIKTV